MNTQLNRFKRFNRINSYKNKKGYKILNIGCFAFLTFQFFNIIN